MAFPILHLVCRVGRPISKASYASPYTLFMLIREISSSLSSINFMSLVSLHACLVPCSSSVYANLARKPLPLRHRVYIIGVSTSSSCMLLVDAEEGCIPLVVIKLTWTDLTCHGNGNWVRINWQVSILLHLYFLFVICFSFSRSSNLRGCFCSYGLFRLFSVHESISVA